ELPSPTRVEPGSRRRMEPVAAQGLPASAFIGVYLRFHHGSRPPGLAAKAAIRRIYPMPNGAPAAARAPLLPSAPWTPRPAESARRDEGLTRSRGERGAHDARDRPSVLRLSKRDRSKGQSERSTPCPAGTGHGASAAVSHCPTRAAWPKKEKKMEPQMNADAR